MATIDEESFKVVFKAIAEIALRANRLNDLVKFGVQFRSLDSNFRAVQTTLKSVEGNSLNWGQLEEMWFPLYTEDRESLIDFVKTAQYLRGESVIASGTDVNVGVTIDGWLKDINDVCEGLQVAIKENSAPNVRKAAGQVQQVVMTCVVRHKNLVNREIENLCRLADALRERLKV